MEMHQTADIGAREVLDDVDFDFVHKSVDNAITAAVAAAVDKVVRDLPKGATCTVDYAAIRSAIETELGWRQAGHRG